MPPPRDRTLDASFSLLRHGYTFLPQRLRDHGSDILETRLLGERAIVLHGPEAAALFYDPEYFERAGTIPRRIRRTLIGDGAVHGLDGSERETRKQMFMRLMTPERIDELAASVERIWRASIVRWGDSATVNLFDEAQAVLCRAACDWSGVPLSAADSARRSRDLGAMVDAFGVVGPPHWRGRLARHRSESWMESVVDAVRAGNAEPPRGSALDVIAGHRDVDGRPLDRSVAAVELLNVIRPIVAIARYIAFEALALHNYPAWSERIRTDPDGSVTERFVHECRRFYPFAPFVGARVRRPFEWHGQRFPRRVLVLLDIYGALHDERIWRAPDTFDPDRFRSWDSNGYDLIPQGGGDHDANHRCAGEWVTISLMSVAARLLCDAMDYRIEPQDLSVDLGRIPTAPASGVVLTAVRGAGR